MLAGGAAVGDSAWPRAAALWDVEGGMQEVEAGKAKNVRERVVDDRGMEAVVMAVVIMAVSLGRGDEGSEPLVGKGITSVEKMLGIQG